MLLAGQLSRTVAAETGWSGGRVQSSRLEANALLDRNNIIAKWSPQARLLYVLRVTLWICDSHAFAKLFGVGVSNSRLRLDSVAAQNSELRGFPKLSLCIILAACRGFERVVYDLIQ